MGGGKRIGEFLVAAGLITTEQLDHGLRNQVVRGGQLGTNLLDLEYVRIDAFAEQLARQHQVPCALSHHFEACDPILQERLPADLAARWHAVPLQRLDNDSVAVASTDPLPPLAQRELEESIGTTIVPAVAPELRVLYWLEKVYGIQRPNRYRRTAPAIFEQRDSRRHYADALGQSPLAPLGSLAKIAVRRIAVSRRPDTGDDGVPELSSVDEALRELRQATGRDRAGDILVRATQLQLRQVLDASALLIIRDQLALGWKGFVRNRDDNVVDALAVPLDEPSVIAGQLAAKVPYIGPPREVTGLDEALWDHLGCPRPAIVALVPIPLFHAFPCMFYAHASEPLSPDESHDLLALCKGLGLAFERLVRGAQR